MISIWRQNSGFILPFLVWAIAACIVLLLTNKGDTLLYINSLHHPIGNLCMSFFTWAAELEMLLLGMIVIAFFNVRNSLFYATAVVTTVVTVKALKVFVFDFLPRPALFFDTSSLNLVEGVVLSVEHTFPSGHTAMGFTLFFLLAFFARSAWFQCLCFALACLVGLSRIYLVQHFLMDVLAGSIAGVVIPSICLALCAKYLEQQPHLATLNQPLLSLLGKKQA